MTHDIITVALLGILVALYVIDSILVRKKFREFEDLHFSHIQAIGCILKTLSGECKIKDVTIELSEPKKTKKKDKVAKKEKGAK